MMRVERPQRHGLSALTARQRAELRWGVRAGLIAEPPRGRDASTATPKGRVMLYWALMFLVLSIVAALFGFGGIAAASAGIAKILFYVFVIAFLVSALVALVRGRTPPLT